MGGVCELMVAHPYKAPSGTLQGLLDGPLLHPPLYYSPLPLQALGLGVGPLVEPVAYRARPESDTLSKVNLLIMVAIESG